jgi:hypothetical protein
VVIPPVEGNQRSTQAAEAARQSASAKLFAVGTPNSDQLPDMPPAEVLDALDTAARVLNELDRKQISIRLETDPGSKTVRAHVTSADGSEQELDSGKLLNVLAGDTASLEGTH